MRDHQADRDQRDLAMKMIDDVLAPRLGDVAEACGEAELQTHHRKACVAERHRELRPEIAARRQRSGQERELRGEDEKQVHGDPDGPACAVGKLHGLSPHHDEASLVSACMPFAALDAGG